MTLKALTEEYAKNFTEKNLEGIRQSMHENFILWDPQTKLLKGRETVLDVIENGFKTHEKILFKPTRVFQADDHITIMEFMITFDDLSFPGVDIIKWRDNKMESIHCYYDVPK